MGIQAEIVLFTILGVSVLFALEIMPLAFTALLIPVIFQITGILNASQAWAGFTNSLVLSLVSIFMLGKVFSKSSFLYKLRVKVLEYSLNGSRLKIFLILMLVTTLMSTLISVTSTVAIFAPIIFEICRSLKMDERKVLKISADLGSFASTNTLPIGSSLSYLLLANSYLEAGGADVSFGLMDFSYMKIPMLLILFAYLAIRYKDAYLGGDDVSHDGQKLLLEKIKAEKPTEYTPLQDILAQVFFFSAIVLMIVVQALGLFPIYIVSVVFVLLSILFHLITEKEAYLSVSWGSIFLIAGTFSLSAAITESGFGQYLTNYFQSLFANANSSFIMLVLFSILSCFCTQFVSNTAIVAIFCPIAVVISQSLGMDPRLLVASVFVGANVAMATPMATTSQAFIYDYAGFQMKEFVKLGWFPCVLMMAAFVIIGPFVLNLLY